jgi:hypothetical protein
MGKNTFSVILPSFRHNPHPKAYKSPPKPILPIVPALSGRIVACVCFPAHRIVGKGARPIEKTDLDKIYDDLEKMLVEVNRGGRYTFRNNQAHATAYSLSYRHWQPTCLNKDANLDGSRGCRDTRIAKQRGVRFVAGVREWLWAEVGLQEIRKTKKRPHDGDKACR